METPAQHLEWRQGAVDGRREYLASYGLALIIAGQPIGWWVRGVFFGGENPIFPATVALVGTLMLFAGSFQRPMMVYASPPVFMAPLLLVILPVVLLAATQPDIMAVDIFYGLFMLMLVPLIACTRLDWLSRLPLAIVWVGGVSCTLALISLVTNPAEEAVSRLTVAGNDNPIIIGNIGATVILAALCHALHRQRSRLALLALATAMVICFANVLLSNTRSVFLGLGIALPVVIMFTPRIRVQSRSDLHFLAMVFLFLAGMGGVAIVALVGIETIIHLATLFMERLFGSLALFESDPAATYDQSTNERVVMLEEAWRGLRLFGNGVAAQARFQQGFALPAAYAHLSYLQIAYDLGVIPFLVYLVLVLIVPLILIVRALQQQVHMQVVFVIGLWLYRQADLFTHGTAYDWQNLFPAMLLYVVLARPGVGLPPTKRQRIPAL